MKPAILSPPHPAPPRMRGLKNVGLALWCFALSAGFVLWIGLYILAKLIRMVL